MSDTGTDCPSRSLSKQRLLSLKKNLSAGSLSESSHIHSQRISGSGVDSSPSRTLLRPRSLSKGVLSINRVYVHHTCESAARSTNCLWSASRLTKSPDGQPTYQLESGQPSPAEGGPPKKKTCIPAFNNPSLRYRNPIGRGVGTSGKRRTISPTNN